MANANKVLHKLVTANHILHRHDVLDAYGHISVRHPNDLTRYVMCADMPPALVESTDDLVEYHVDNSDAVDPNAPKGYTERFIHGELYKRFPEIGCVIHSHAQAVLPYVVGTVPLVPVIHKAGFLGQQVKVWDILPLYTDEDQQDMLVKSSRTGSSLAAEFASKAGDGLSETAVLMKRHGFTTYGPSIEKAVYHAIYLTVNAEVQTQSMLLQNSVVSGQHEPVTGLSARQANDCSGRNGTSFLRGWELWVREVETDAIYRNEVQS